MEKFNFDTAVWVFEKFGPNGLTILFFAMVLYYAWPHIIRLIDCHIKFVERVGRGHLSNSKRIRTVALTQTEHGKQLSDIHKKVIG